MLKVLLNGSGGRMGQAIQLAAPECGALIACAKDVGDDPATGFDNCDVVVDFSVHSATPELVEQAASHRLPVVIGTTGHNAEERRRILDHAGSTPIVWAGNYSVGVNLLFYFTRRAAELLDASFEPEIIEMHHHSKIDAPSGTAERLVEQVLAGRSWSNEAVVHGRSGLTGKRPGEQVGVHAIRGGSIVGDHSVLFAGESERFELRHHAEDRRIFAIGALKAAHWVAKASPGLYNMEDVLGLK